MMRDTIVAAIVLCLAGCVVPTQAAFEANMSAFLGRPEVDVIAALGVPTRSAEAGGLRFIEYEHRRIVGWTGRNWHWGSPYLGGDYIETRECRLTFTLRDSRVVHFDSRGNDCLALPLYAVR
ncbi:MAG: hypothetical protein AB7H90_20040 [Alphaproteobacteria bacterium]